MIYRKLWQSKSFDGVVGIGYIGRISSGKLDKINLQGARYFVVDQIKWAVTTDCESLNQYLVRAWSSQIKDWLKIGTASLYEWQLGDN